MAELLRIVRATEVDCLAQPGCDPFARAAEVAMASELSPIFQFGWLDLADLGEFSVQVGQKVELLVTEAWRVALLQVALTWLSPWNAMAFEARAL